MPIDRQAAKAAGYTDAEIDAYEASQVPQAPAQPQVTPSMMDQLTRQLGLTARAGVQGLTALPALLAEPIRQGLNLIPGANFPPQKQAVSELLTNIGLPTPATPIERVVGTGAEALAGAGGIMGLGKMASTAAPVISDILTAAPATQAVTAGAGGVSGQLAAEMGAGPVGQFAASTAGGLTAGMLTPKVGLFSQPTPAKERIAELIKQGIPESETAGYKLQYSPEKLTKVKLTTTPVKSGKVDYFTPAQKIERTIRTTTPKLVKDKIATETIKQGFDEGVISAVKGATRSDKRLMARMADVMERGKKNAMYAMENRPTDVVGDSLMRRFSVIKNTNAKAGALLDKVANTLKGKKADATPAMDKFFTSLDDMGINPVRTEEGLILNFDNSDIAGLDGPIKVINHVFNRLKQVSPDDAYNLHRLKRFISEQVTYGKNAEGLAGKAEIVLKGLRRDIDSVLDNTFPRYNKVNTAYSETIDVLDMFQDLAGRKMDLTGPNVDKAVGQLMRGVMSNNKSRVRLMDSINDIERTAVKYGGKYDDNLLVQSLFADELDRMFGPAARTSFQGQISQAVERTAKAAVSPREEAIGMLGRGAERLRGINQENAFSSIKNLLRE